jgi:NADP-dependent 3-hydroxy acid dehydrogenase YdfG
VDARIAVAYFPAFLAAEDDVLDRLEQRRHGIFEPDAGEVREAIRLPQDQPRHGRKPVEHSLEFELENKVALITGGYGGMGRASARLFAKEGATVFIPGRRQDRGSAFVAELVAAGGKALFVELDVVNQAPWDAAVVEVKKRAGSLHILMNIVGSNALMKLPEVDIDEWNKLFEINVTGTLRGIQTCAPLIKESGGGSIVNIGSVAGITGNFGTGYSSSKWALDGLSRSAAYVSAPYRTNERSHHMLQLLDAKDKAEHLKDSITGMFHKD